MQLFPRRIHDRYRPADALVQGAGVIAGKRVASIASIVYYHSKHIRDAGRKEEGGGRAGYRPVGPDGSVPRIPYPNLPLSLGLAREGQRKDTHCGLTRTHDA